MTGIIWDVWYVLPGWFPTIALDEFVVMPNHVHFVVWIRPPDGIAVGATLAVAQDGARASLAHTAVAHDAVAHDTEWVVPEPQRVNSNPSLGDVVRAFKSLVFKVYLGWIRTHDPARSAKFWQRNYYEHVVRNERALQAIRRYIRQNPDNWKLDRDNLDNTRHLSPPKMVEEYVREALDELG